MRLARGISALTILLQPLSLVLAQQPAELPSAESIFERYVAVTGGQEAYDRFQNQVTLMTLSKDGEALSRTYGIRTRKGDFRAITIAGGQTEELGLNDGVAWKKKSDSTDLLDPGAERDAVLRDAVLLSEGRWRQYYKKAETVGIDRIDGKRCYAVVALPFAGEEQFLWYDQKTGLLVKQVVAGTLDTGVITYVLGEYFEAGGILMAKSATVTLRGVTLLATIESVQFDQPLPDSTFELPVEVSRILQKQSAQ